MPARTPFADRSSNNSTVDPTVNDDDAAGWDVGSRWINTTTAKVWFATDVSTGAAVWKEVTYNAAATHPVHADTVDPTVTDDANGGYNVGDHWVNTAAQRIWQAIDVTIGAAIWERIDQPKTNIDTSDPTTSNDNTQGYEIGSTWVNTAALPPRVWVAVGVSTGAAEWRRQTNLKHNIASVDPTPDDDSGDDYEIGSQWYNTLSHELFLCINATATAAKWRNVGEGGTHILPGVAYYGLLLDYPTVGSLTADEVQYVAQRLFAGITYDRMIVFIDSGGTAGRFIQLGVYTDSSGAPNSRVAQTDIVATNVTQPGFYEVTLTDGAATPLPWMVPADGTYWLAITCDTNAVKFSSTNQYRANFLPKKEESGGGGLPPTAGTLANNAGSLILMGIIEQGVVVPV